MGTGLVLPSVRVLVYHPERVQAEELSNYENLAEQQWQPCCGARIEHLQPVTVASMLAYRGKAAALIGPRQCTTTWRAPQKQ